MRTFRVTDKVKGRFLFRVAALHYPISRRSVSENRLQQCHSGIIRVSQASPFIPHSSVVTSAARASSLLPQVSLPSLRTAFVVSLLWKIALPLTRTIAPLNAV